MKVSITIGERTRTVEEAVLNGQRRFKIDGMELDADAIAISPTLYSILMNGRSFEAHVRKATGDHVVVTIDGQEFELRITDPRSWRRRGTGGLETAGAQEVIAPMPGKVVRTLVTTGELVKAGQGLAVIEAMKMQNEVKSPKSGKIERLLVAQGQTVNGGEVLAIVS